MYVTSGNDAVDKLMHIANAYPGILLRIGNDTVVKLEQL